MRQPRPPIQRFISYVKWNNGCWVWISTIDKGGYSRIKLNERTNRSAHRWYYESIYGPVPQGMQLDHLCRNRACVNPMHLEVVTPKENTQRSSRGRELTTCANGHSFSRVVKKEGPFKGWRKCAICERDATRRYRQRQQERATTNG